MPANLTGAESVFSSKKGIETALAGIYQSMTTLNLSLTNGGLSLYLALSADELETTSVAENYQVFYNNSVPSSNSVVSNLWGDSYRNIYRTNAVVENIHLAHDITDEERADFIGQALFIRGFYYQYLAQLFSDVPLILNTNYLENAKLGRWNEQEVMKQAISDIEEAERLLQDDLDPNRAYVSKKAAQTMLSRLYLLNNQVNKAEVMATKVIGDSRLQLETNLDDVFKIESKEVIWQISKTTGNVAVASSFIPSSPSARPLFMLSERLLSMHSSQDKRAEKWIKSNMVNGIEYHYPFKYNYRVFTPIYEYYVVLRYAELFLNRAEARLMNKDYEGAVNDLNVIRRRSGLEDYIYSNENDLKRAIEDERFREFFTEWGHRWFDIRRLNRADDLLGNSKPNWSSEALVFPIPQSERLRNPALTQNPGYDN